jgi:hypothetical protein
MGYPVDSDARSLDRACFFSHFPVCDARPASSRAMTHVRLLRGSLGVLPTSPGHTHSAHGLSVGESTAERVRNLTGPFGRRKL